MKSNRLSASFVVTLLAGVGVALACGGPDKVAEAPGAAKVVWGKSDETARDESSAEAAAPPEKSAHLAPAKTAKAAAPAVTESGEGASAEDGAIDLDAMVANESAAASKAKPESATASKAKPEPAPKAKPEPEPEADDEAAATPVSTSDPVAAELQRRRNEKARRAAQAANKGKKPSSKKGAAAPVADAEPAAAAYTGSDPCRAATFNVPRVREACSNGGRAAAKRVMKDAIGHATATGQSLKCSDCHANQRDYSLKSNAVKDLKHWLDT